MPGKMPLKEQRRLAVQLRLDGNTIEVTRARSGLSAPTIIAAHKAYLAGGWAAVDSKPRGRQTGDTSLNSQTQSTLRASLSALTPEQFSTDHVLWSNDLFQQWLNDQGHKLAPRSAARYLKSWGFHADSSLQRLRNSTNPVVQQWLENDYKKLVAKATDTDSSVYWAGVTSTGEETLFFVHTPRKQFYWINAKGNPTAEACIDFLHRISRLPSSSANRSAVIFLTGIDPTRVKKLEQWLETNSDRVKVIIPPVAGSEPSPETVSASVKGMTPEPNRSSKNQQSELTYMPTQQIPTSTPGSSPPSATSRSRTHLQRLEAESIHIMREVVAEAENPVMLYSIGKDSAVMAHLAVKAFFPAKPPFPLLHIDTTWKFRAMYEFRDRMAKELGFELLTHTNPEGLAQGVNPFSHGSSLHTELMKTEALKQALGKYQFDAALGGARRDEELSRAKERIFSFRTTQHRWEPSNQRPELWRLYNCRKQAGESIRVFPLSNWTELDIWQYIQLEGIPVVPLYLSAERPVVMRDGSLIMVDDDRIPLHEGEVPMMKRVRFRTLGCYPLTGACESTANSVSDIIEETKLAKTSERSGRMIDHDKAASMEKKKQEGYF